MNDPKITPEIIADHGITPEEFEEGFRLVESLFDEIITPRIREAEAFDAFLASLPHLPEEKLDIMSKVD